ncbi:hypothetical protein [Streptomyces camelliae]|uniref:Uncharacterized protein n=1 Tax=Streptomyces camelliae TaxID=3004093 RepID=A0ABY7PHT5_9ACTN|nr:hypothetical protein [Streptomyces sp. HUAS 2-6]WBO69524.1 hypothetical protein O1G22_32520 [Streptomyces sp. HUAS 2-6]
MERFGVHGDLDACVLFWPAEEFAQLLERWPTVVGAYGDDHGGHLRQVERTLRELSDQGPPAWRSETGHRQPVGKRMLDAAHQSGPTAHAPGAGD